MVRVALACSRHRRAVLAVWVLVLVGLTALSGIFPSRYANDISLPGTQSQAASDVLKAQFPERSGATDQIVFKADPGKVIDARYRARIEKVTGQIASLGHVTDVTSPFGPAGRGQIAKDQTIAFAPVTYDRKSQNLSLPTIQKVVDTAKAQSGNGLQVELGGPAVSRTERTTPTLTEAIGVLAAVVILMLTFGSVVAMGLPITTALFGLGSGLAIVALGSRLFDTADFAPQLAAMIGLGVGIDYSLFIVTRFRDAFAENGGDIKEAVVESMDTAGRSVLFAGFTVVIAILGMLLLGVNFLYGVAIATSAVVFVSVVAALTITPALLSFKAFGSRVGRGRHGEDPNRKEGRLWAKWADAVVRRRWLCAIAGFALLIGLTIPAFSMRQMHNDAGNDPSSQTTRKAYDLLAEGFGPGFNGPMTFVVTDSGPVKPDAIAKVRKETAATEGVAEVSPARLSADRTAATFVAYPQTAPQDAATTSLVNHFRDSVIPSLDRQTGTTTLIGGFTPGTIDLANTFASKLPVFISIVVLLSALLLMVVFRSLLVPVKAALMNLLSIGAALGVVTLVFQEGYGAGIFGIQPGPIEPFLPVMMFAIIFGLSMDYEVFIVSRIREEWVGSGDARASVRNGLAATGRVVTAAAAIMICVFASFMFGGDRVIKMFGLGLSTAVFLDAFVIRVILLPAVMDLAANATWWLPAWLDRLLPKVSIETRSQPDGD